MALNFLSRGKNSATEDASPFSKELSELISAPVSSPKGSFTLKNVPLKPDQLTDLATALRSPRVAGSFRSLSLVGCNLSNSTHLKPVIEALKSCLALESVDFSNNPLKDSSATALASVLQYKLTLVSLKLRDCAITSKSAKAVRKMLQVNKSIRHFDLSENELVDDSLDGVTEVCKGLLDTPMGDNSRLEYLNLSKTGAVDSSCKMLASVLISLPSLRSLLLRGNDITKTGVKHIAQGIVKKHVKIAKASGSQFAGLEELDLSMNALGNEGIDNLSKRIPANATLRKLHLEKVNLTSGASLKKLISALVAADCVEVFSLADNNIADDSLAVEIVELVSNSSNLVDLSLAKIAISGEDVKILADLIGHQHKCGLKNLDLSGCAIDDNGAVSVAHALKTNTLLETLNVTSNPFGPKGAKSFARTFRMAKTLKKFYVTGASRITAEGENYLAEALKYNKTIEIRGASRELDYMTDFIKHQKAFDLNSKGEMIAWSESAWQVVKRGCGQIISTVIYNMKKSEFEQFKRDVLLKSKNVVKQDMFEYVIRHAETPALDAVATFVNKCKIHLDSEAQSIAGAASALEKRKSDYYTYRFIAKDNAKDPMVREMAANKRLFLGRYLTENGPAIHATHDVTRFQGVDTLAVGSDKGKKIFVQIYEDDHDFARECEAREAMKMQLAAGGPFAIYDTILKEVEVHDEASAVSFKTNITDLRHCINNLGVTSGFDLHETVFLAKRSAQCLGTINNLGRIHGDFRPRNFLKVAKKRLGTDPVGRTNKQVLLPDKWVVFDLSKSSTHGESVWVRDESAYMPPEIARVAFNTNYASKQFPTANEKMDVWAFGAVLFQLLTGVPLFQAETNTDRLLRKKERLQLMNWINLDDQRLRLVLHRCNESQFQNRTTLARIKTSAVDLLNWCLQGDPYNRPSFNEILSHPFFTYKTHVNYTEVDLLLGWYKKIGVDASLAHKKNNRVHAHVLNSSCDAAADVFSVLKFYYAKSGCQITSDVDDWKLDIDKRREKVQKARTLIVLVEKGVFWRPEVVQKMLWAMDSIETTNLILVDLSTAFNVEKFDFDAYLEELESEDGQPKMEEIVNALTPMEEKLHLTQIAHEKSEENGKGLSKQKKWLSSYIRDEVNEYIMSLKDRVIPCRSRDFQTQAMVREILHRSGFVDLSELRDFSVMTYNNSQESESEEKTAEAKKDNVKVLVLYHEATMQASKEKIRSDALALRSRLFALENADYKPEISLVSQPEDVYQHFTINESIAEKNELNRELEATSLTLVVCLVSQGFYEAFREEIVLLNAAKGLLSVVPVSYAAFDVGKTGSKEEVLNLGLENTDVLERLKDNRNYIPLPMGQRSLQYETDAAHDFILKEAAKVINLTKKNEQKDENDMYVQYSKTNFFSAVH